MNDQANGIYLMLPFPEAILNPNRKAHWGTKSKPNRMARDAAYILAKQKGVRLDVNQRYIVSLVFCPPDHRERDLDNLTAAMKSALDGMCRGLGINDKKIRPVPDWGPLVEGGKVEVTIKVYEESVS